MPHSPTRIELSLPARGDLLPLVRRHLEQAIDLAHLPEDEASRLLEAAFEGCANVVDHAYLPGEDGPLTVWSELTGAEILIGVCDQGLPIGEEHVAGGGGDDRPAQYSQSGGMGLIRDAVDRSWWVHKGREGKELRLLKLLPSKPITETDPALQVLGDDVPLAPNQEYTIRRFRPEDAVDVARCIYQVYGTTYIHEDCYYPERIVQHNEVGTLASVVAVDSAGTVVGHYALERPGLGPVAERGIAVVSPAHRGRDLMGRMRTVIEDEARALGLRGVWSCAVTKHVASQRVNEAFGSDVCGIMFAGIPAEMDFRGFAPAHTRERVSGVLYFTYIDQAHQGPRYLPDRHRDIAGEVFRRLEVPVQFASGQPPVDVGEVEVLYSRALDIGTIKVHRAGTDTLPEIRRASRDLLNVTGADVVELHLPLMQPATPELAEAAEREGFFFCGIGPAFLADGDALILQKLAVPIDPEGIQVANSFARDLVHYIEQDRRRVASLG